jgi:TonB family protein
MSLMRISALAQDTTWSKVKWKMTPDDEEYVAYETKLKTDSGLVVKVFYENGVAAMTGLFVGDSLLVQSGVGKVFTSKGVLNHLRTFTNGKPNGEEVIYSDDGKEMLKGANTNGEREGEWTSYYPSGKVAGKAVYKAGEQTSATLYNEDGSVRPDRVFMRIADFAGGTAAYAKFIKKNVRYPDYDFDRRIQGTVVVLLKISKTGQLMDVRIDQPAEKHLDAEALRALRLLHDFEPAILGGLPVDSWIKAPVVFKL